MIYLEKWSSHNFHSHRNGYFQANRRIEKNNKILIHTNRPLPTHSILPVYSFCLRLFITFFVHCLCFVKTFWIFFSINWYNYHIDLLCFQLLQIFLLLSFTNISFVFCCFVLIKCTTQSCYDRRPYTILPKTSKKFYFHRSFVKPIRSIRPITNTT